MATDPLDEKRERWLEQIRADLASAYEKRKAGVGEGRIAVRASAESLNWLREQLSPEEFHRLDLHALPGER